MDNLHLWKESFSQRSCLYNTLHKTGLAEPFPWGKVLVFPSQHMGKFFCQFPRNFVLDCICWTLSGDALLALMLLFDASFSLIFFMLLIHALCEDILVQTFCFLMEIYFESCIEWGLEVWDRCFTCQGHGLSVERKCFINIISTYALGGFSGELIKLTGRWALPLPSISCLLSAIVC